MKPLATLFLAATVSLSSLVPASAARADVWMVEILSLQTGVSPHHVDSYMGALDLVARRHGGVRVSRFHETSVNDAGQPRLVGMWRFPTPAAMQALLDDPAYQAVAKLRKATFDAPTSPSLSLVADRITAGR